MPDAGDPDDRRVLPAMNDLWGESRENLRQWAALAADFYDALHDLKLPGRVCEEIVIGWAAANITPDESIEEPDDDD